MSDIAAEAPEHSAAEHAMLGGQAYGDDRFLDARHHIETAFRGFRSEGDSPAAARMAIQLGELHHSELGNSTAGRGWLERARRLLDAFGPCVEWGYLDLAIMACDRPDAVDLLASANRALALAHEYGDAELELRALADGGLALITAGRVQDGFRRLDEAAAIISSGEADVTAVGQAFCSMLSSCDRAGALTRAEEWTGLVRERVLEPLGGRPRVLQTHCLVAYGALLFRIGRWNEAEAVVAEALGPHGSSSLGHRVESLATLASLRIEQGRLDEATQLLAGHEDRIAAARPLARIHLASDEPDLAAGLLQRALRQLRGDQLRAAPLLGLLVVAELARGNVEAADTAAKDLSARAAAAESEEAALEAALAAGRVAVAQGRAEQAVEVLCGAADGLDADERPALVATLRLELAEALALTGDTDAAIAEARAAHAVFSRLGATRNEDRSAAMLRRLGAPATAARRAVGLDTLAGLSSRELEVLELLRQGLTNAEIAARLFISPKTAEHHVGRILTKLGVRSRAEAAAVAASRPLNQGGQ